jgi:hypothetical protein
MFFMAPEFNDLPLEDRETVLDQLHGYLQGLRSQWDMRSARRRHDYLFYTSTILSSPSSPGKLRKLTRSAGSRPAVGSSTIISLGLPSNAKTLTHP